MSGFKNTALTGLAGIGGYLSLDALGESGVGPAKAITDTVDSVAGEAANILQNVGVEIGSLAPVSDKFISELSQVFTNTGLADLGVAGVGGLMAGWLGKKGSQIAGAITGVQSEKDDRIAGIGIGSATAFSILGASTTAITLGIGTTGYVLGRKLGEKILGEKYANITGAVGALCATGLAWGAAPGIVLGTAGLIGSGTLLWKAGESSRQKKREKKEARKSK